MLFSFTGTFFLKGNKGADRAGDLTLARVACRTALMDRVEYAGKTDYGRPPEDESSGSRIVLTWLAKGLILLAYPGTTDEK